jgi:uncharacterized protein (TIGR01777 family)
MLGTSSRRRPRGLVPSVLRRGAHSTRISAVPALISTSDMKLVLPGGTGQLGHALARAFHARGDEIVILARDAAATPPTPTARVVAWDGRTSGPWARELDRADAVINLAGRSVNCRYTPANLAAMMSSRVDSTRVLGDAIAAAPHPPHVWLQMSTATIYAHRFDAPNDELTGRLGGDEPDVPAYWKRSIDIAHAWERAQAEAVTPRTRKVALRAAMVMGPEPGGVFQVLSRLVRLGLGGAIAGGRQYMSWIHERDFTRAVDLLLARDGLEGAVNLAAPFPLPQREFMAALRAAWDVRVGLPATRWMAELGAFFVRTDTELVLKSRRVVPARLLGAGFSFDFPEWPAAARELVARGSARE